MTHCTLLSLESLHKAPSPFFWCHVEGNARKLAVDVECALQLQKVPVLHDHLGLRPRHSVLKERAFKICTVSKLTN